MLDGIKTLDDIDFKGKTTLVRVDINTPLDIKTSALLDDRRFKSHRETLTELIENDAKVVVMAHQGRPGDSDFTTLEKHAGRLSEIIDHPVQYVDGIFGSYVTKKIRELKNSDVILLENLRFHSEENIQRPSDVQATTLLVRGLSKVADIYVNDAFATAHRSQPSIVGFPEVLPSVAGRLMEKELKTIHNVISHPKKPTAFVLGGTKADDSLKASEKALKNGTDYIITGGLVANLFLAAKGYRLGDPSIEFIRGKRMVDQIDVARRMLEQYDERIILPVDLALKTNGDRKEIQLSELPKNYKILDVGRETTKKYAKIIKECGTIFAKGALGTFEDKKFAYGTEETIKAIANSDAFSVVGGGHLVAAARELNVEDKINHISSGGGACISLLAGDKLPAVEALRMSN